MAIYTNPVATDQKLTNRELTWITIQALGKAPIPFNPSEMRAILLEYENQSTSNHEKVVSLFNQRKTALVPDSEMEWIDPNNFRLKVWLRVYSENTKVLFSADQNVIQSLIAPQVDVEDAVQQFICGFDLWRTNFQQKREYLNHAKMAWAQFQEEKKLKWLDKNNEHQLKWAWSYIHKKPDRAHLYAPTTVNEFYTYTVVTLDHRFLHPAEFREYVAKMRGAWAQAKYKANLDGRKPSTYVLSNKAIEQLKKLSRSKRLPLNVVLEDLIGDEFVREGLSLKKT